MNGFTLAQQELDRTRAELNRSDLDAEAVLALLRQIVDRVRDALTGPADAGLLAA